MVSPAVEFDWIPDAVTVAAGSFAEVEGDIRQRAMHLVREMPIPPLNESDLWSQRRDGGK